MSWIKSGMIGLILNSSVCWGNIEESIRSSTSFSSAGVFSEWIEVSKQFFDISTIPLQTSNAFPLERDRQEPSLKPIELPSSLPFSWILGAVYNRSTSLAIQVDPVISDDAYSLYAGVDFQVSSHFDMSLRLGGDAMPAENYSRGAAVFQLEYILLTNSLFKRNKNSLEDYDSNDARQYYRHERLLQIVKENEQNKGISEVKTTEGDEFEETIDDPERERSKKLYPNLKIALQMGVARHVVGAKNYRRISIGAPNTTGGSILEFLTGPELTYSPNRLWTAKVAAHFYHYNDFVDHFLPYLESSSSTHWPIMNGSAWATATNQFLSFPDFTLDLVFDFHSKADRQWSIDLNETYYSSYFMSTTFSVNPSYVLNVNKNWRLGAGTGFTLSTDFAFAISGSVFLNYIF